MVQVEGMGKQPPSPSSLVLTAGELRQLLIEAKRRAFHRGYEKRSDSWGRGMTGELVIANVAVVEPHIAPVFIGLCGEYAVSVLVNRHCHMNSRIDLSLLPGGDSGHDLEFFGLKVQVKTRKRDYGKYLVRENNRALRANVFVFGTWGGQSVDIEGCIGTAEILACEVKAAPSGRDHKNYVIDPCDLLPMKRLYDSIGSRR